MSIAKPKTWTYKDYYSLNDDKRYELIEGELIEMAPSPSSKHQIISINLGYELINYVRKNKLGRVIASPIDIIFNQKNVLQPDIVFIANENMAIIKENGIFGSPDLVVEILSPASTNRDRNTKFKIYEKFKVKEYWIIDPSETTIEAFFLENNKFISCCSVKNDEHVKSKIFQNIELSFNNLTI